MKALSLKQPWVHAILREGKDIENRTWQRDFRGWIALHASAKPNREARFPRGHGVPDFKTLDYSAICGVAWLEKIVIRSRSKWFDGSPFGWVLTKAIALKRPIPCKGSLGLWDLPPNVLRSLKRQLPRLKIETQGR